LFQYYLFDFNGTHIKAIEIINWPW